MHGIIMILILMKYYYLNKIDNEYLVRYSDLDKVEIVPQQLKIKNSYGELHTFTKNDRVLYFKNDDKELFKKIIEKYGIRLLN